MPTVKVLDCTLRDGGYCNDWCFGKENIKKILNGLNESNVDLVECGYLSNKQSLSDDYSLFHSIKDIEAIIPPSNHQTKFVFMINYGEYAIEDIPLCGDSKIFGIRVAFHKKDIDGALEYCRKIKEKGYSLFVQPMVSLSYSDEEFIDLINRVNRIHPFVFYIVDSFGVMKRKDLIRLFYMVEHNLDDGIAIGYHSHNNMQLAYSNAQSLADIRTNRNIIIDASTYGMGRGAGNLNTELFVEYLNDSMGTHYYLKPLLTIIDEVLAPQYQQSYWGYSLPNYLSAKHNAHPNYASYLDEKKTLTVEAIDEIFSLMETEKKFRFDKAYIEALYLKYLESGKAQDLRLSELKNQISGKQVLIIAPGKSSVDEKDDIISFANQKNVLTISVNFDYEELDVDYIFLSNLRRFRELSEDKHAKCIVTSNIPSVDSYIKVNYGDLLNQEESVHDNAGLMLIKLLINLGVEKIYLAGMDGYSLDPNMNYGNQRMVLYNKKAKMQALNDGMNRMIYEYGKRIQLEFITEQKFVKLTK